MALSWAIVASGQYGTPLRLAVNPGGVSRCRSRTAFWSPSGRVGVEGERRVDARAAIGHTGPEGRVESTGLAGQGAPSGPSSRSKNWVEVCSGSSGVPRGERAVDRIGPAAVGGREQAPLGAEQMQVELVERELRKILRASPSAARYPDPLRLTPTGQLDVHAEAVRDQVEAVRIARLRVGEVDEARQRRRQRRGDDFERSDLRLPPGTAPPRGGSRSSPAPLSRRSCRRRRSS